MSPPAAFKPKMRDDVMNALLAGSTYRDACAAAGIPWNTWLKWCRAVKAGGHSDPDVDALVRNARQAYALATNSITAQIRVAANADWRAAAFLLEHRRGDPKAKHDNRRARWEADIAQKRANNEHIERVAVDGVGDELIAKLRKAIHGEDG